MNQPIRAIETRYAGCRFRSRLEARWAIFWDALGVEWDYEVQGFHTPAGGYLPDFYLPNEEMYVEIKGPRPSAQELAKCQAIPDLIILVGSIPRKPEDLVWWDWQTCRKGRPHLLHACEEGWVTINGWESWAFEARPTRDKVQAALTEARSARFEHGETGRRGGS